MIQSKDSERKRWAELSCLMVLLCWRGFTFFHAFSFTRSTCACMWLAANRWLLTKITFWFSSGSRKPHIFIRWFPHLLLSLPLFARWCACQYSPIVSRQFQMPRSAVADRCSSDLHQRSSSSSFNVCSSTVRSITLAIRRRRHVYIPKPWGFSFQYRERRRMLPSRVSQRWPEYQFKAPETVSCCMMTGMSIITLTNSISLMNCFAVWYATCSLY